MTTYIVSWSMFAFEQLNALRGGADDLRRFDAASDEVDYVLRRLPDDVGESRDVGFRLWYGDFFTVYFSVNEAKKSVNVISIALSNRQKR